MYRLLIEQQIGFGDGFAILDDATDAPTLGEEALWK